MSFTILKYLLSTQLTLICLAPSIAVNNKQNMDLAFGFSHNADSYNLTHTQVVLRNPLNPQLNFRWNANTKQFSRSSNFEFRVYSPNANIKFAYNHNFFISQHSHDSILSKGAISPKTDIAQANMAIIISSIDQNKNNVLANSSDQHSEASITLYVPAGRPYKTYLVHAELRDFRCKFPLSTDFVDCEAQEYAALLSKNGDVSLSEDLYLTVQTELA